MAQVYFHCLSPQRTLVDECGADVDDLIEAREYAAGVVGSLLAAPGPEDWRGWALHVSDELGREIFVIPFSSMLVLH